MNEENKENLNEREDENLTPESSINPAESVEQSAGNDKDDNDKAQDEDSAIVDAPEDEEQGGNIKITEQDNELDDSDKEQGIKDGEDDAKSNDDSDKEVEDKEQGENGESESKPNIVKVISPYVHVLRLKGIGFRKIRKFIGRGVVYKFRRGVPVEMPFEVFEFLNKRYPVRYRLVEEPPVSVKGQDESKPINEEDESSSDEILNKDEYLKHLEGLEIKELFEEAARLKIKNIHPRISKKKLINRIVNFRFSE